MESGLIPFPGSLKTRSLIAEGSIPAGEGTLAEGGNMYQSPVKQTRKISKNRNDLYGRIFYVRSAFLLYLQNLTNLYLSWICYLV